VLEGELGFEEFVFAEGGRFGECSLEAIFAYFFRFDEAVMT